MSVNAIGGLPRNEAHLLEWVATYGRQQRNECLSGDQRDDHARDHDRAKNGYKSMRFKDDDILYLHDETSAFHFRH